MGNRGLVFDGRMLFVAAAGAVAALLVWGLMAAPALAQANAGDVDLQVVDCSQVQAAVAAQYNSGDAVAGAFAGADATASAGGSAANADAVAAISQYLDISQSQVNACLGGTGGANPPGSTTETPGDTKSPDDIVPGTKSASDLPNTGGTPLPLAALGLALVAAGILSAGSIIRRGR